MINFTQYLLIVHQHASLLSNTIVINTMRKFTTLPSFLLCNTKARALICPDKFKFTLSAQEVSHIIQSKLPKNWAAQTVALADGGEGSLEAIADKIEGQWIECSVLDPLFRTIKSKYYLSHNQQSYIEMARASGLQLLTLGERNPMKTSSFGTGQLILDSLKRGHSKINLLIGGSATNDGGIGAASALGYRFFDEAGTELRPVGGNLREIKSIRIEDSDWNLITRSQINVYTDVTNKFTGMNGATRVYGPQKGADPSSIQLLEQGMSNLRNIFNNYYRKDVNQILGSGAAGGLGGSCNILFSSKLKRGIQLMFAINDFQNKVKKADLVITGEGKVDGQTMKGKVVNGVVQAALRQNKKVLIICAICENRQQMLGRWDKNIQILQVLSREEQYRIDKETTKKRIQQHLQSYFSNPHSFINISHLY